MIIMSILKIFQTIYIESIFKIYYHNLQLVYIKLLLEILNIIYLYF